MSSTPQSAMKGTGIGQGVALGPVARMSPPPVAPTDETSSLTHHQESERVKEAIEAVAADLTARGETAGAKPKKSSRLR